MKLVRTIVSIVTAVSLYILFSFTSILAGAWGLLMLPFNPKQTANIMHSMDMLAAAMTPFKKWNGRSTVSKECGREEAAGSPCKFCRFVCWFTNRFLELDHCKKEAARS